MLFDGPRKRLIERRPACTGVELCRRVEERMAARAAFVGTIGFFVHVLTRECRFRPLLAQDMILLRREPLPPLLLALWHGTHVRPARSRFYAQHFLAHRSVAGLSTSSLIARSLRHAASVANGAV